MKKDQKARIAEALGAARVVDVGPATIGGPLDLLALREDFGRRLRSSGGRPTDPSWRLTRQVPFREESWSRLQGIAEEVGASGRRVGPAQIAAVFVEERLDEMEEAHWLEVLDASREISLLSQPDAAEAAGVTYNQFDEWVQRGWLLPAGRQGHQRTFGADEVVRGRWLRSIAQMSADLTALAEDVRASDLSARYLVATADAVGVVASRSQLYRLLETPGGHLVLDQLPERRDLIGLPPFPEDAHDEAPRRAV